ncbi:T9SS type A sorting domain-containing protein [Epilithonimonas zeae]|uniref:T9SS type A sorting domain-containing protein n=1 Tax=Epilithonimonas zeae TaxID=1416779 RepID=UPI00200CD061|nr:T9SS type A sorting domain-containing protein [Epilithonimonas zeae]UQB69053.1 T9SS type A sorting domain-containing protein [Epilithonimonas zeae]
MKKYWQIIVFLLFSSNIFCQTATTDSNFNPEDIGFGNGDGANSVVSSSALQPDGKIIIGGKFTSYNGTARNRIARLNSDGTIDTSFNIGTGVDNTITDIILQPDGKIIIGGDFTNYNGSVRNRIARLNKDGTLDASFNIGTGVDKTINDIALQSDGKVLIGGAFTVYSSVAQNRIARLNSDGSLDTNFSIGNGADASVNSIVLQSDGKILIGGDFTNYKGSIRNRIARLTTNGTLDLDFNPASGANNSISCLSLQSDGKILISGDFTSYDGTIKNHIARLNDNGNLDTSFNIGSGSNYSIEKIIVQPDNKIIVAGAFSTFNSESSNRIARLNEDGTLDRDFYIGTGATSYISTIILLPTKKILIGGDFTIFNHLGKNRFARLDSDGTMDLTFNPGSGASDTVTSIALQPDGKILVGGYFISHNGMERNHLARLNIDGTLDLGFKSAVSGITEATTTINSIGIQSDGKIIIVGQFSFYEGSVRKNIARVNADGSLDRTFLQVNGAGGPFKSLVFLSDGKILIGGQLNGHLARLNANGSIDTTFNPGIGADHIINTVALQPNGKILVGGLFNRYNNSSRNRLARLNEDGTLDTSFNPGTAANNDINTIVLQSDGKILIGGNFTSYNGIARNRIARLNNDGTLDTNFNPGSGANNNVNSIAIQSDGKILIAGIFTTYNGISRNRIARLNANGTLDVDFNPGGGADNTVHTIALQPDNKILIGGAFVSFNGIGRNRIARLTNEPILSYTEINEKSISLYPNPVKDILHIDNKEEGNVYLYDMLGNLVTKSQLHKGQNNIDIKSLPKGNYILFLQNGLKNKTAKIIKE